MRPALKAADPSLATGARLWGPRLARVLLATVFAWAAVPKLLGPGAFAVAIDNYRVLPPGLVGPLALVLPVLELVVAAALLAGPFVRGAGLLSGLLLLAFGVAMAQAKFRGIDLECGCFGAAAKVQVSWWTVARNLALCVLGFGVAFMPERLRVPRSTALG